jgi:hypothetical protein
VDWIKLAQNSVQWRAVECSDKPSSCTEAGHERGMRVLTADKLQHPTAQRIPHVGRGSGGLTETGNQTDTDSSSVI